MLRLLTVVTLVAGVAAAVWWVQAPPRSTNAYRESAEETLEKLRSRVDTARLWIEQVERNRVFGRSTLVALEEADSGASSALSKFESYDPPRGLEPLRTEVATFGSDVTTALGDLRIAAHQDRWARASEVADGLPQLSARARALLRRAQP